MQRGRLGLLDIYRMFVGVVRNDIYMVNFFEERPISNFRFWVLQEQEFVSRLLLDCM